MPDSAPLFVTIVLDGVGIGAAPDAADYGETTCDTLGHVCALRRPPLPNLAALGLGRIRPLDGVEPVTSPTGSYGRMREVSPGMDSTTGHWELAGLVLERAFPTYPDGFSPELVERFRIAAGLDGVLDGGVASGTEVIERLGDRHRETGHPILYTSADSVFQIATHVDGVPIDRLYAMCEVARREVCTGADAVGRVIARPFTGGPEAGGYRRLSSKRHDYAIEPSSPPIQSRLQAVGVRTVAVGKIADLFAGVGFDESRKTTSNAEGVAETLAAIAEAQASGVPTFVWTNLVDFDQEYGHRNDLDGFAGALADFDRALPSILAALPDGARLAITADHGNDPSTPSTDHNREYVPLLYVGGAREPRPRHPRQLRRPRRHRRRVLRRERRRRHIVPLTRRCAPASPPSPSSPPPDAARAHPAPRHRIQHASPRLAPRRSPTACASRPTSW